MQRQYFLCRDLNELEEIHDELLRAGFADEQVHVLSDDEDGVSRHHMQGVNSFSRTDIIRSTLRGALIGVIFSAAALLVPFMLGLISDIGWTPFIFLAIIAFGFSIWEGGLWGVQEFNSRFSKVESSIHNGQHLMIIDFNEQQKSTLNLMLGQHPRLTPAPI